MKSAAKNETDPKMYLLHIPNTGDLFVYLLYQYACKVTLPGGIEKVEDFLKRRPDYYKRAECIESVFGRQGLVSSYEGIPADLPRSKTGKYLICLLYTSDAADE
eukprot:TRINITY_DN2331_c0_g1_i3.p1 TRINITY_DN2331_c0_g1~~TRINITY_DN2331_c0_g1_i3.p1  ORF type:complete len:104 (-),score=16.40 TRINITY_DN2331_c0_g1_i3:13-324(-)